MELQFVLFDGEEYLEETKYLFASVAYKILNNELDIESPDSFEIEGFDNCQFILYKTKDFEGDDIVRIIESDMQGYFPKDEQCDEVYRLQIELLVNE